MTWIQFEDVTVVVDTEDVGWKLRYNPRALVDSDFRVAASILSFYAHLTDPLVEEKDAIAALKRARQGTREVWDEIEANQEEQVAKVWVVVVTLENGNQTIVGPHSKNEAAQVADTYHKSYPSASIMIDRLHS